MVALSTNKLLGLLIQDGLNFESVIHVHVDGNKILTSTDYRCFGDAYVHQNTENGRWFLTESNCPNTCATGICGKIPYTTTYSSITSFADQYTCTETSLGKYDQQLHNVTYIHVHFILKIFSATDVTCPNGKDLFEVSCSVSDGFDIRINESCRKSYFPFIDFANSFLWGDQTKVHMDRPSGSTGVDVDQ